MYAINSIAIQPVDYDNEDNDSEPERWAIARPTCDEPCITSKHQVSA
jgi:hypothetical protein